MVQATEERVVQFREKEKNHSFEVENNVDFSMRHDEFEMFVRHIRDGLGYVDLKLRRESSIGGKN